MSIKAKIQIFLAFIMLSALFLLDLLFTNFLITSAGEADRERLSRELSRTLMSVKGEEAGLPAAIIRPEPYHIEDKMEEIEALLRGNTCGPRSTSCADQLAVAVQQAYEQEQAQK